MCGIFSLSHICEDITWEVRLLGHFYSLNKEPFCNMQADVAIRRHTLTLLERYFDQAVNMNRPSTLQEVFWVLTNLVQQESGPFEDCTEIEEVKD